MNDIDDFSKRLSEMKLRDEVGAAEIENVEVDDENRLKLVVQTVDGEKWADRLPEPERWDHESDLVVLLDFLKVQPSDLGMLLGERLPFEDDHIVYHAMRQVLEAEKASLQNEWDMEKRRRKLREHLNN